MPYKLVISTEGDPMPIVREQRSRRTAIVCASVPATSRSLFGGQDVEVIGLKGERLVSSSIGCADTVYLATRDEHRITIQGYPSAEDAEQARADLRPGVESQVREVGARLPWLDEMAEAGPGKTRKWEP